MEIKEHMTNKPWVILTGATGFIGSRLRKRLCDEGYSVLAVSRNPGPFSQTDGTGLASTWDDAPHILSELGIRPVAIINLAGENISSGRWTRKRKERILGSRSSAAAWCTGIAGKCADDVVLLQASAIGYYGYSTAHGIDETGDAGTGFLAEVTRYWEDAARDFPGRRVFLRFGVVLGDGGALRRMTFTWRLRVLGYPGNGRQWLSWVHVDDACDAVLHLLRQGDSSGAFNIVSPEACTISELYGALAARRSALLLPVPAAFLRLMYGKMAGETILADQRIVPARLLATRYSFTYPHVTQALRASGY